MAGDWIKLEHTTPDKPEVVSMAARLKIDQDAVVGKLVRIWIWADQNSVSGADVRVTSAFIDRLAQKKGFADAMKNEGWLSGEDGNLSFTGFGRHNGQTAKARAETNRRVAEHRQRKEATVLTIPKSTRRRIADRDGNTCRYCARGDGQYTPPEIAEDAVMSIDHVVPRSKGGSDDDANLVLACMACNRRKGERTPDEAGMKHPCDASGNKMCVTNVTLEVLPKPLPEKRREEDKTPKAPKPGGEIKWPPDPNQVESARPSPRTYPPPLRDSPAFIACWEGEWLPYLLARKGRVPPIMTTEKHLLICVKLGADKAIAALKSAIEKDWAAPDENAKVTSGAHFATVRDWEVAPDDWKAIWRDTYPPEDFPDAPRYEDGTWEEVRTDHKKHIHDLIKKRRQRVA
jgi:5-methylcytosine-specific restriction endonuclease McrA